MELVKVTSVVSVREFDLYSPYVREAVCGLAHADRVGGLLFPNGLVIGNNAARTYILTLEEIKRQYEAVAATDSDLNGTPDLLEDIMLSSPRPFVGVPFAITGAIEAEQFDLGGKGVAYTNTHENYWTNDYRPSGMEITNCTDKGGGYCVDKLREKEWLKFTIDVRVRQNYAIEARMAAIGQAGGVFQIEFSTNGVAYTNTGLLTVTNTAWHDVTRRMIWLENGTNVMKFSCLTNAPGTNVVGKFNYLSIYPAFNPGVTNTNTHIVVTGLVTNESWFAATNNAGLIQKALDDHTGLSQTNGLVIIFPEGRYFVAQRFPDENRDFTTNSAVYVSRSNTEIAGAGKTNTTLITWFRSTSAFVIGVSTNQQTIPVTNFTMRNLSLEGRPHSRGVTNTGVGGFTNQWENGGFVQASGLEIGSLVTVFSLLDSDALFVTNLSANLLFTNCLFRNPGIDAIVCGGWSNCLITACDFLFRDTSQNPTNGIFPFPRSITDTNDVFTGLEPDGDVGIWTRAQVTYNTVAVGNTFKGCDMNSVNTDYQADAPDGLFWGSNGANWFVARNAITNYGLEAIMLHGGPCAAVGNDLKTYVSLAATCAFASANGTENDPARFTHSIVGNVVDGGRMGLNATWGGSTNLLWLNHHFCGNTITLFPPFPRSDDPPRAMAVIRSGNYGNFSGNTLLSGAQAIQWTHSSTNAIVLKNNFAGATYRGITYNESLGAPHTIQILKNKLNSGGSYHLHLRHSDSGAFYLWQNTYTNGLTTVEPFLDAYSSSVHFMR